MGAQRCASARDMRRRKMSPMAIRRRSRLLDSLQGQGPVPPALASLRDCAPHCRALAMMCPSGQRSLGLTRRPHPPRRSASRFPRDGSVKPLGRLMTFVAGPCSASSMRHRSRCWIRSRARTLLAFSLPGPPRLSCSWSHRSSVFCFCAGFACCFRQLQLPADAAGI